MSTLSSRLEVFQCAKWIDFANTLLVGTNLGFRVYHIQQLFKPLIVRSGLGNVIAIERDPIHFFLYALAVKYTSPLDHHQQQQQQQHLQPFLYDVCIWNEDSLDCIHRWNIPHKILRLSMTEGYLLVITLQTMYIYDASTWKLMQQLNTYPNACGVGRIMFSFHTMYRLLIGPGTKQGQLRVHHYWVNEQQNKQEDHILLIDAHKNTLAIIEPVLSEPTTNPNTSYSPYITSYVATCSERGTLVRIFNLLNGDAIYELRRGWIPQPITSICFHPTRCRIIVISSTSTVHIFDDIHVTNNTTASSPNQMLQQVESTFKEWMNWWWYQPPHNTTNTNANMVVQRASLQHTVTLSAKCITSWCISNKAIFLVSEDGMLTKISLAEEGVILDSITSLPLL